MTSMGQNQAVGNKFVTILSKVNIHQSELFAQYVCDVGHVIERRKIVEKKKLINSIDAIRTGVWEGVTYCLRRSRIRERRLRGIRENPVAGPQDEI